MAALDDGAIDHRQIIAALRRELDERTAERDEALAQQAATGEILSVISRSPSDIQPVFEAIVARAAALCEAEFSAVARLEDGLLHLVAVHSMSPEETAAFHSLFPRPPARNFAMGRAFVDARPVHFADVLTEFDYDTRTIEMLQSVAKYRSFLGVPIFWEGRPIGVIGCGRREVRPFTAAQIDLVKTFADQAAIAIENVRLFGELEIRNCDLGEALEQQTATAEVLQVINSSPGDLAPVFDAMLERATRLCEVDIGTLWTYDGEMMHAAAIRGAPPRLTEFLRKGPHRPAKPQLRMLRGERIVQIADVTTTEAYRDRDPVPRAIADLGGVRTLLIVPLRKDDTVLGNFAIYRCEVRPFTDKQIALLESFAAQAVIAMENARLLTETREALEQQTATAEVLQVINSSPGDLAPVFDRMLDRALHLCGAAFGILWTYDGEWIHAAAIRGATAAFAEFLTSVPHPPGRDNAHGRLLRGERFVHIADAEADAAYRSDDPLRRATVELGKARTILAVPLRKDEVFLGDIVIYRREVQLFSEKQIALLENFAAQAVIAIENARLITETREALEQQTATAEVLGVINSSPGDLAPVFETILDKAHTLCGATLGSLFLFDGELFRAAATNGYPEDLAKRLREGVVLSAAPQLMTDGVRCVHNPDLTQIDTPTARAVSGRGGVRTNLMLPLRKDGKLLGAISCNRQEVRPFTDKEIALLENFAAQAVIAMENARLLGELQARTDELTRSVAELQTLEEVSRAVNSSLDLDTVLATIVSRAAQLSQADEGTIYEFEETEEVFLPKSAYGMNAERVEALRERRIKLGETHLGRSALLRAPVYVQDVQQDPSVPHAARTLPGIHAVLAVPLLRDDKVIGGLVIRRRSEAGFAPTIPTLLQTFAGQAVLAIENARLFQELGTRGEEARRAHAAAEAALADLRRAQDRLIQAEKMASLGQLTAGIAHEIKNPLNFVNNFAGLSVELLDELKETAAPAIAGLAEDERADVDEIVAMLTGNLEKIAEHGRRADGIVKSMLEHSRGGSGERREVDLNGLVEEALNLAYHGARAQDQDFNITLERDFDHALAPVELVPQDMTRVLLNLFGNGFYAATKRRRAEQNFRPALKVATHDRGEAVEIRIRDNGTGIPPEIRDKLFQPFFTTKPTGEGTGLGLSISWDIVTQQHGGTIEVASEVGAYTEFTVRLPRIRHMMTTEAAA